MIRLTLVAQTGLVGFQAWCFRIDRWYMMILFLIFLGGVLVLLIYISCLAQNETTTLRLPLSFIAWALPIGILIPACHNQTASLNWIRVTKLFGVRVFSSNSRLNPLLAPGFSGSSQANKVLFWSTTLKNTVPINTCAPWNPVAIKKQLP
jgi:uncharacterized integral membrane protein